jgi:N-acetylglucosamine-6-phosphate deacetylase
MEFNRLINKEKIIYTLSFLFFLNITQGQQRIEGLSYLDGKPVSIVVKEGKIVEINRISELPAASKKVYVAPGMIDNQVNGFAGVSFLSETRGVLTLEDVKKATQALWERGVTTYLATLTSNSHEELLNIFSKLGEFKNDKSLLGSMAGFHLEGPYISPEEGYRGAHTLKFIRNPDWNEFMQFYKASGNSILTVTIAPELDGAMDFIKRCTDKGIVVALGHHNANAEIIKKAVENGAKICTHLGNGCANLISRHLNPLWPQLSNDELSISIICDGFHLNPEEIRVFYKVKGSNKTLVTSDVTEFAGMPPGIYKIFDGSEVELTVEGELRYPAQKVLYGSASAMDKGIIHIMKVTDCSLADAIKMSSTNQAKLYSLNDRGSIDIGKRADLILFEMDDSRLKIIKTFVRGELVFNSSEK